MGAQGILFSDYASHPRPKRLYVDSSFAIAVLFYELNRTTTASLPRHSESYNFYQALAADRVDLTGSILTYSELLQYYCFVYPGGMYDLAKDYCRTHGASARTLQEKYKILTRDAPACDAAWQSISHRVGATEHFIDIHKIIIRSPLPSPMLTNITRDIVNYASILKDAYSAIEATDSLHLSIAQYLDSDAVATLDAGFLTVDSFKVYYTT